MTGTLNCMDMRLYVTARYGRDVLVTYLGEPMGYAFNDTDRMGQE